MSGEYTPLTVLKTREEIGGLAKTVVFDAPHLNWAAGQHLPIRLKINGEEVRRSYSISASPHTEDGLRISVKRLKDGLASNFINDTIMAGDVIEAAPPNGGFFLEPGDTKRRTHYFFGAGSGITPLYAMLTSVMAAEPNSFAHLAYGNNNEKSVMLEDDLNAVWQARPDRMSIHHVFTKPGWWSSADYWRKGYIDEAAIEALITENPPYAQDAHYYVCGPGAMNTAVKAALMSLDVPSSRIHMESYGGTAMQDTSVEGVAATAQVTLNGQTQIVDIAKGQTVLEAAKAAGLKPPFSCQSGVCGSYKANLTKGEVHMRARMALEEKDIDDGAILTCQSLPKSAELSVDYD
jgi:ring-1,2-phenylacetyl-CoA epoxidase subunit PaaE